MSFNPKDYPPTWAQMRTAVQRRAGNKCETCGVPNHVYVSRTPDGYVIQGNADDTDVIGDVAELLGVRITRIVCTTAHIFDNDRATTDISRLKFECQSCHLRRDLPKHMARAADTRARKRGMQPLVERSS